MDNPEESMLLELLENYPIARKIINECDLPSIASLQKVNRRFREVIRVVNPKFAIRSIDILMGSDIITMVVEMKQETNFNPTGEDFLLMNYLKHGANCLLDTIERERETEGRWEHVFSRDLVSILKFQKYPLESLEIEDASSEESDLPKSFLYLVKCLQDEIKWQNGLIKTKEFKFISGSGFGIGSFGDCIAPGILKKYTFINYGPTCSNVADFEGMESQAEQLVEYEQSGFGALGNVSKISHLRKASLQVERMGHEKLVQLKHEFLRLGPPKDFKILVKQLQPPGNFLGPIFGEESSGMSWFYRTNFNGKVLRIHISNSEEGSVVELNFVTILDVPVGAMLQIELLPIENQD
ncbi:unnamed protein product [Caenorhabditis nigoni]